MPEDHELLEVSEDVSESPELPESPEESAPVPSESSIDIAPLITLLEEQNTYLHELTLNSRADFELNFPATIFGVFTSSVTAVCLFVFLITYYFKR